jgi:tripartite-type tricarboxylate transporter receptor subunit TctC
MTTLSVRCRRSFLIGATFSALAATSATAADADYPAKPVRVVVPYGPGGIADVTMRLVAENLSNKYHQQFYVENRPGAGGIVGMQAALQAPSDGYTMVMIGGGLTIAKALFKHLPYDIEKDVEPVSTTASYGLAMATGADSSFKSVAEFIAAAKAKPGGLNIGTINAGSTQNLAAELFRLRAGVDVTIIPYKTTPELASAVLRGDVQAAFEYFAGFQSQIASHQMRVLATTGKTRAANLPDVPTLTESGVKDYDVTSWNGLAVRTGTPPSIVQKLHDAVAGALASAKVQQFAQTAGMEAKPMQPDALRAQIKADVAQWSELVQRAGVERH